ncbi:MAG: universal stress protein [Acidimicrobiales bacterium]|nr:universal stress protein [Acidimicrobiales bacterium]
MTQIDGPPTTAPTFEYGRTVTHVALPAKALHLHERCAPFASELAAQWGVPLRLIHVSDSLSGSDPALDAVVSNLHHRTPSLAIEAVNVFGSDVARALADAIDPHAFVVMSTEHADAWRFKGSVAESVAGHVGAPLLLIGPNVQIQTTTGEIVVAVDGSLAAESAIDRAVLLSKAFSSRSRIWMVRVVSRPTGGLCDHHGDVARALQSRAESTSADVDVRWEIIQSNDPIEAITAFAARRRASFIVTGMRSRNDMRRKTMGSITMGLVHRATQPVMPVPSARVRDRDIALESSHQADDVQ